MPTKRARRARLPTGITVQALEAWRTGDFHALNRALSVRPWQPSPFDVPDRGDPPAWEDRHTDWQRAQELRRQLVELAGAPGRMDRNGRPPGPAQRR